MPPFCLSGALLSENYFLRIKCPRVLSSTESRQARGWHCNPDGSTLTTVVFPEAGGPSIQILGAVKQEYVNVKVQNSKNSNWLSMIALHNVNIITMKQLLQLHNLPAWRLQHWALLGGKEGTLSQRPLGLPLISVVNKMNTLTRCATWRAMRDRYRSPNPFKHMGSLAGEPERKTQTFPYLCLTSIPKTLI